MRINSTSTPQVTAPITDPAKLNYQVKVLKKALEGQKDSASELLKMLDPKGKIVDIRA
ncbi:MAG: hypothetical protein KF824_12190 [Fimbriimonadaceae bacterium]|nr:hypothetical protein [Fimbriimonadaceae bacterium]QYK53007.1 MAG: hypothetical protein KF824_12190 [Fimbriimonadaceae bacterium]